MLQFLSALSSTQGPQLKEARSQVSSVPYRETVARMFTSIAWTLHVNIFLFQVAVFVGSHVDVFASVLTDNLAPVSVSRLQELSLVTGVISLCQIG